MSRAKIIDYYLDKLSRQGFELHQVRQELEANKVDEEEIKAIVRIIDNELRRKALSETATRKGNELVWMGAIIAGLGALVTIGTYLGLINTGNYFIIAYGPFFAGVSVLLTGLAKRRGK